MSKATDEICMSTIEEIALVVPAHWIRVRATGFGPHTRGYRHFKVEGFTAMVSVDLAADGLIWIHGSIARTDRMPDYQDLVKLKAEFIGDYRKAVMVLPPKCEHVNIHPFCLHLFSCINADKLPDFRHADGSI